MPHATVNSSTAPCSFFALGKCNMGSHCKFYHASREDLAKSPLVCKFYLENACKLGRDCKFSHDSAKLGKKREKIKLPCKFYSDRGCSAGNNCLYLHVDPITTAETAILAPTPTPKSESDSDSKPPNTTQNLPQIAAWAEAKQEIPEPNVEHLSDFISREEEIYYYGAPGDFATEKKTETQPSYRDIAVRHEPCQDTEPCIQETVAPPKPCTFHLQGACRYGDSCFYSHSIDILAETAAEREEMERELAASRNLECNICFDVVLEKGERFGLLSGCHHAFCLNCIRNWRGHADQPKQSIRQCPLCRVETHFIVPSNRMVTDLSRKEKMLAEYKENLADIPCRHFDQGRGTCPFGTSCFYAHQYRDGTHEVRQIRTAVDSDGNYDVLRQLRLDYFLSSQIP